LAWLFISSGRGPIECQLAVSNLVKALIKDESEHDIQLLDYEAGEHGFLSALLTVNNSKEFLDSIHGTVKWICPSPLRVNYPRKNWFISVSGLNEPDIATEFKYSDLKFDTFRSSGPGGQHTNVTDSAVRVTHIPTGLVAKAQEERSQFRNKSLAVARLLQSLKEKETNEKDQMDQLLWTKHNALERGNEIRTYVGPKFLRK
jgi:peptide chain release factor